MIVNMAEQPQLLKFLLHLYKAPGVSDEEFSKWYREEYIPRAVNILKDYGVEQYKLVSIFYLAQLYNSAK